VINTPSTAKMLVARAAARFACSTLRRQEFAFHKGARSLSGATLVDALRQIKAAEPKVNDTSASASQVLSGKGTSTTPLQTVEGLAEEGNITYLRKLGVGYIHGLYGLSPSVADAVHCLYAAAKQEDSAAAYWLGYALKNANTIQPSIKQDDTMAAGLLEFGAEAAARLHAGRAVLAELRAMRKAARKAKNRREAGLPTKEEHAVFDVVGQALERSVPFTLPTPPLPLSPSARPQPPQWGASQ
jgi:TPR repeat protein